MLVRRWAITGTLDPLRALTRLTVLSVATNALIGIHQLMIMVVFGVRDLVLVMVDVCVCVFVCVCVSGPDSTHSVSVHGGACVFTVSVCWRGAGKDRHTRSSARLVQVDPVVFEREQHRRYVHHRDECSGEGCVGLRVGVITSKRPIDI